MSHELLLLAGRDRPLERVRRAALVRHAALAVPGAVSHLFAETPHGAVALVESAPSGGDHAEMEEHAGNLRCHVATTPLGLVVARRRVEDGRSAGAEAGHVRLDIADDGSVELSTDGVAFLPCFWAEHRDQLYVSTHLASLVSLGVPADEDPAAVLQYLVMFHPLQHRTLLRHAALVPPGGHLRWNASDGATLSAHPLFVPSDLAMTDDEAVATFRHVWPAVASDLFERNAASRTALALSGGLDSRAIAVGSAALKLRPLAYTYGDDFRRETMAARRVAMRLELPHLTIPVVDDRLLHGVDGIAARLDGAHGPAEMYESWFADLLRSIADVVINGLAGGPLWGDDKAVGLVGRDAVLHHMVARYSRDAAAVVPFLATAGVDAVLECVRTGILDSMSAWDFSSRADTAVYWKVANRQMRWGNMLVNALRRAGLQIEAPFLDGRFLRFAARLTPRQRANGSLYLRVHREVFERTADIGRSDDGNSPRSLSHVYWSADASYARQLVALTRNHPVAAGRRALRRSIQVGADALAQGGLTRPADRVANRASVFPAETWLRTGGTYADRLADLVGRAVGAHPMLDDDFIDRSAVGIRTGHAPASAVTLGRVGTLALWLTDYSARAEAVRGVDVSHPTSG